MSISLVLGSSDVADCPLEETGFLLYTCMHRNSVPSTLENSLPLPCVYSLIPSQVKSWKSFRKPPDEIHSLRKEKAEAMYLHWRWVCQLLAAVLVLGLTRGGSNAAIVTQISVQSSNSSAVLGMYVSCRLRWSASLACLVLPSTLSARGQLGWKCLFA